VFAVIVLNTCMYSAPVHLQAQVRSLVKMRHFSLAISNGPTLLPLPCMTACPLKRSRDPHELRWYHMCVACLWLRDTVSREREKKGERESGRRERKKKAGRRSCDCGTWMLRDRRWRNCGPARNRILRLPGLCWLEHPDDHESINDRTTFSLQQVKVAG
jgi:hypothetical protein